MGGQRAPASVSMSDVSAGMGGMGNGGTWSTGRTDGGMGGPRMPSSPPVPAVGVGESPGRGFVPLGQLADIRITGGPPMVRDEGGLLVGYVYVDIDQDQRDIGGYVNEAKHVVQQGTTNGDLKLPQGYFLKWTGQYEQLAEMSARMKIAIPVTFMIIFVLLFLNFGNLAEVLIILLSIPFALVGSVWVLWLLDYRLSTAVWVGVIALVGLAAQTGIVMIVYIDNAYKERKRLGKMHGIKDIIAAHMEGTVQRVRPKLMTVGTMLVGLIPLLWATGSGADVMKRIAAPMVGGLVTSAFLTLVIIPLISTYWRQEQLLHELLEPIDPGRLSRMRIAIWVLGGGWILGIATAISLVYGTLPQTLLITAAAVSVAAVLGGTVFYMMLRPAAHRLVWPPASSIERSPT